MRLLNTMAGLIRRKPVSPIVSMVCRGCGSDQVEAHATASWNDDKQEWELSDVLDYGTCPGCGNTNCRVVGIDPADFGGVPA